MNDLNLARLDWDKGDGLLPAIVQHAVDGRVLMLGYMNEAALRRTLADGRVTFFSRSRNQLWTKGETSGHFLHVAHVSADCDRDSILVLAHPDGPTCHNGTPTCFAESREPQVSRDRIPVDAAVDDCAAHRRQPGRQLHGPALCQRHRPHRAEGGRRRCRDGAGRGDTRRSRTGRRMRRPAVSPAGAAEIPQPHARAGRRRTRLAAWCARPGQPLDARC